MANSNSTNNIKIYVFTGCTSSPVAVECNDQITAKEFAEKALWECECPAAISSYNDEGVWTSATIAFAKNSEAHQHKIARREEGKITRKTYTEDGIIDNVESPLPFTAKVFDAPALKKYLSGSKKYHLCCTISYIPAPQE